MQQAGMYVIDSGKSTNVIQRLVWALVHMWLQWSFDKTTPTNTSLPFRQGEQLLDYIDMIYTIQELWVLRLFLLKYRTRDYYYKEQ